MPMPKKIRGKCPVCGGEPARSYYKFCSSGCCAEFQYQCYIKDWISGKVSGLQGMGIVSNYIKRYLRRKYNDRCCLCGWSEVNSKTGKVPLVADHIDGNWRNNVECNLRLICPNCDSLSPTYAGSNRGNGRKGRVLSNRAKEGKLFTVSGKNSNTLF